MGVLRQLKDTVLVIWEYIAAHDDLSDDDDAEDDDDDDDD